MKYLIAGASGQLAKAFIARFEQTGTEFDAPPATEFDITDSTAVERIFAGSKPDVIINCAAYNNVDAAEKNPQPAFSINAEAVKILADAAAKSGAVLVHYGTDYVFDGKTEKPYCEDDAAAPLNAYGESKLAGENISLESEAESLMLRLSWVYGDGTQNFLHKMLQWSDGRDVLKVVWDQISVPTYTEDIVTYTLKALDKKLRGCYHLTNSGYATRYEVAKCFFKCISNDTILIPVGSDAFPSPVKRPFFSAMSNKKLSDDLNESIPSWEDALTRFVAKMKDQKI
jgi:dTDP-4-dehydrorhamnose reductase